MSGTLLPPRLKGARIHMVGIKGTGMAALAEILSDAGAVLSGSDVAEPFYTDELLLRLGVRPAAGFDARNLPAHAGLVVHSAAWDPSANPELLEARRRGVPVASYPQVLGELSTRAWSVGISGVHGKTTTTALVAAVVRESGLPGTVLAGSVLREAGGRATLVQGSEFFVAETDEYRRHFMNFRPSGVVVTSVEADHLDCFADAADVERAFFDYCLLLPPGGLFVYCADDPGAASVAGRVVAERRDLDVRPYGESASGEGEVSGIEQAPGELRFAVGGEPFSLPVPGTHNALNAAAALLVCRALARRFAGDPAAALSRAAARAFAGFPGTRRRAETVGEAAGVLVVDDYAHHPTAVRSTLRGLRGFYPGRRIVLSFMSHTYSRTLALLDEFARAVAEADVLILHDIYASARESNPGGIDGEVLAVAAHRYSGQVHYVPGVLDALTLAERIVRPGDLFVTMGAGNNWQLGAALLERLRDQRKEAGS